MPTSGRIWLEELLRRNGLGVVLERAKKDGERLEPIDTVAHDSCFQPTYCLRLALTQPRL